MKAFRWGIIGCGGIAGKFAEAVRFLEGMEITAAASRSLERARRFTAENGISNAYDSYEAMLKSGKIDAVYIATVNSAHYEQLLLAIDCGVPVLCEKPMLLSVSEFDVVLDKAKEKQVPVMEAMWTSFLPSVCQIRDLLRSGAIGALSLAYINFCVNFPKISDSRIYNPALGGGLIFDIGVYNLHTALRLFGTDYIASSVCGFCGETGVDTRCAISLVYPDGMLVNTITADVEAPRNLSIYGTNGSITADYYNGAQHFTLSVNGKEPERFDCPFDCNGFEYEIRAFAETVKNGKRENEVLSPAVSRKVCELMDSAYTTVCGQKS